MLSVPKISAIALSILFVISFLPAPVGASHYRYGNIAWSPVSGTTIQFSVQDAWRRTFGFGCMAPNGSFVPCSGGDGFPAVGDIIAVFDSLVFGDGGSVSLPYIVTSIDTVNDWMFGSAIDPDSMPAIDTSINHTYASAGNYLAEIFSCCRISSLDGSGNAHINNPDATFRMETLVNVGTGNASPASSLPPIVSCPINATCSFTVPASDPNGDTLSFRFSNSTETDGLVQPGPPDAPEAASINSATGLYTWNTTGATLGPSGYNTLYSTQVMIEDHDLLGAVKSKIPVDFFIQLVNATGSPPVFDQPPTPTCGSVLTVDQLGTLTFTVQASDADAGDNVTLNVAGLPAGATMTPPLPTTDNPVSSTFSWTPPVSSAGTYVVIFSATDTSGQQALCSFTILVSLFVIPESPLGTLLLLLLPIAALILYSKARPIRFR